MDNSTPLTANTYSDCTITVTDAAGNTSNALAVSSFHIDLTNPTLQSLSPADNATGINSSANLIMSFDENIAVNAGNITIKQSSDGSTFETISVASDPGVLTINNNTLTINPGVSLADNTEYYVLMDPTFLRDISENNFTGISGTTDWSFTTADISPPTVTGVTVKGSPNDIDTSMQFILTFDENANAISTSNFTVTSASGNATGDVTAVSAASGTSVDVTVSNISGAGSIRLDLNALTNITNDDSNGDGTNGYVGTYTSGATHDVDRTAPVISQINAVSSPTNDSTPNYGFTTNEAGTFDVGAVSYTHLTLPTN